MITKFNADRDAMGHMLFDYLQDPEGDVVEIIERSDGYIEASSNLRYYFSSYPDWPAIEHEAFTCVIPGRALDLGCGAGRWALALQAQGHSVVGVDNSPMAIEVCRRRGVTDARVLSVTQVGPEMGIFDNIIMMGNNWGLMGNIHRAKWLLKRFYRITSSTARLIAESNDIYQTENPLHLAYQAWNRERGRMSGQIRLRVRYKDYISRWMDYLMVSKEEMQSILAGSGWRVDRFIQIDKSIYCAVICKE